MATILLIANPFDTPTKYGYYWLKRFSRYAAKHGHQVIFQKTPTLPTLQKALTTYNPRLVIINGHGGRKAVEVANNILIGVTDYDPELNVKIYQQNPGWFSNRIVLLLTCSTGKELAFRLIDYGADAVLAFREPFIFLSEENHSNIAYDKLAEPFFISLLQPAAHLARGATFGNACHVTRKVFTYYRDVAEAKGEELTAKYLNFNLENMVCLGNMWVSL